MILMHSPLISTTLSLGPKVNNFQNIVYVCTVCQMGKNASNTSGSGYYCHFLEEQK
jgi:hypothetical protein